MLMQPLPIEWELCWPGRGIAGRAARATEKMQAGDEAGPGAGGGNSTRGIATNLPLKRVRLGLPPALGANESLAAVSDEPGERTPGLSGERPLPVASTAESVSAFSAGRSPANSLSRPVLTAPRRAEQCGTGNSAILAPQLTRREKLAAKAVAAHPAAPVQAIAAALDLTPRAARSLQRVLERKGAI